jgi:putative radical SAM enzyme (TIGR03279 family)
VGSTHTYGGGTFGQCREAVITEVEPGGPADRAGLTPGLVVSKANGQPLRDVIDWRWESDGPAVDLDVIAGEATLRLRLEREAGETWGFSFGDVLFDGVRTCRNACAFCFMAQLPPGLRRALYVRDDDYRLSFLQGNFVTLTNLTHADVDRIIEQSLSPLYVSLHAVTPAVRNELVCAQEDRALQIMDELLASGIELHVQIVLVPGVNDGDELEASLQWLAARGGIRSVGVVPLGYTRHQQRFTFSYETAPAASQVLDQLDPWRSAFLERDGIRWVHAADEFYLNAGRSLPPAEAYDGFPQFENGIGLVRDFTDEVRSLTTADGLKRNADVAGSLRPVVVTGTLFAPVLRSLLSDAGLGPAVEVLPVENAFFGGNVSVAGLLAGADIVRAVCDHGGRGLFLVPTVIFNEQGVTIDDVSREEIRASCGAQVEFLAPDARALLSGIL